MKKFNTIMLSSKNDDLIKSLTELTKEKMILINKDINKLEKLKNYENKIIKYPLSLENKTYEKEITILKNIIKKKIRKITAIIIDTNENEYAQPFCNVQLNKIINLLKNDIENTLSLIKNMLDLEKEIKIIIILHEEKKQKNDFFIIKQCINTFIKEFMKNINDNNKNIKLNCISTKNIDLKQKKLIYPFKKKIKLKNIKEMTQACIFIMNNNIKNKIITV